MNREILAGRCRRRTSSWSSGPLRPSTGGISTGPCLLHGGRPADHPCSRRCWSVRRSRRHPPLLRGHSRRWSRLQAHHRASGGGRAKPGLGPHARDRNLSSEWHSERDGHRQRLRPCGRQDQVDPNLRRPQSGPRSRRAAGVARTIASSVRRPLPRLPHRPAVEDEEHRGHEQQNQLVERTGYREEGQPCQPAEGLGDPLIPR